MKNKNHTSLFHTVVFVSHSVGYIFHSVGYKSRSVKQRIDKGILGNIEGVFYFHIMRHAVSVFFCMIVIYMTNIKNIQR